MQVQYKGETMHYFQFNIKSYQSATAHLSNLEDLAYRRLIEHYYDTEKIIPSDLGLLSRRLRIGLPELESVLSEFFTETENGWENEYCDDIINEYHAYTHRQSVNGSKGGRGLKASAKPVLSGGLAVGKPDKASAKPITNYKQETINNKTSRNNKKPVPPGFGITPELINWGKSKSVSETKLNEHMENFINQSLARDYRYVDWNAAFRNAVKANWAKLPEKREPKKFIFE